jgi:twinkle protein
MATDITEIKHAMNDRAREVAEYLLPRGFAKGHEWCVGSVAGEAGESLKVRISGSKAGTWCDFAGAGESGDLIDLWQSVKGVDLRTALDQIRAHLGIEKPRFESGAQRKTWKRPERPKCAAPRSAVREYLTGTRKISDAAISAYRLGETGRTIVFPSLNQDGELCFVKYLEIDRKPDGKKNTRVEAGCEPILFGWQAIEPNCREIAVTEGEIDALTAFDYGIPALSVPFGGGSGGKQAWIESEFENMARFETIYLALDMDKEGDAAAEEIARRLGRHRCRRVKLPFKDMNECRQRGITATEMRKRFDDAGSLDPAELQRAAAYTDAVVEIFWPKEGTQPGYRLPFANMTDYLIFRPGELTLWTGATGSGKSQILSHACLAWGEQGARICVASLEMAPAQQLRRMVKQATNTDRPTEEFIHHTMKWLDGWLWLFTVVGKSRVSRILEIFEYARCRYGCDVFIIDSLMRLGIGSEDYEGQEKAVFEIVSWAVSRGVHVHLVAHARKSERGDNRVPELDDVKGASEIASNAFNVLAVWRNRRHEDEVRIAAEAAEKGDAAAEMTMKELRDKPGVIVGINKQRNGDFEGKFGLWFNQTTYQYRSAKDHPNGFRYAPPLPHPNDSRKSA